MDLMKLLLKPDLYKTTCFLCYKQEYTLNNIHDENELNLYHYKSKQSVYKVMKYLVPSFEILFQRVCNICKDMVLKIYILIQNSASKQYQIKQLISQIEKQTDTINASNREIKFNVSNNVCYENFNFNKYTTFNEDERNNRNSNMLEEFKKSIIHIKNFGDEHIEKVKSYDESEVCETCGKVCNSPKSLKSHLNCHKIKQCPYCGKSLKTHSHFKIHVKNHEIVVKRKVHKKYYLCHDCNYKSMNKNTLEAHIYKTHLGIRPFKCDQCYKSFYKNSNLREHIQSVHAKMVQCTCEICGESFANNKTFVQHLKLHTQERAYECNVCNKKFISSGRRLEHIKSMHTEKSVCCLTCDKKFSLKKQLNWHMKKKHPCVEASEKYEFTPYLDF